MAYKISTFFIIAFLLFSLTLTYAIRSVPSLSEATPMDNEYGHADQRQQVQMEENCVGVDEDECLLRRSLAAHLDYVYTVKHHRECEYE